MLGIIKRLYTDYKTSFLTAVIAILGAFIASIYQLINNRGWLLMFFTLLSILLFTIIIGLAIQSALEFRNDSLSKFMGYFETKDAQNSNWFFSSQRLKAFESEIPNNSEIVIVSRYLNYEQDDFDSFLEIVKTNINIKNIKYKYMILDSGENLHIRQSLEKEFKDKIEITKVKEIDFDYPSDIIFYSAPTTQKIPISLFMELPSHRDWKQRGWIKIESKETGLIIEGIQKTIIKYKIP